MGLSKTNLVMPWSHSQLVEAATVYCLAAASALNLFLGLPNKCQLRHTL